MNALEVRILSLVCVVPVEGSPHEGTSPAEAISLSWKNGKRFRGETHEVRLFVPAAVKDEDCIALQAMAWGRGLRLMDQVWGLADVIRKNHCFFNESQDLLAKLRQVCKRF